MDRFFPEEEKRISSLKAHITVLETELADQRKANAELIVLINKQFADITRLEAELAEINAKMLRRIEYDTNLIADIRCICKFPSKKEK